MKRPTSRENYHSDNSNLLKDILLYVDFWFLQSQFYWLTGKTISSNLVLKKPWSLFSIFVRNLLNLLHSSKKKTLSLLLACRLLQLQRCLLQKNESWIENGSMGYVCFQSIHRTINNFYTIAQVILAFWLVLSYDLLEDRYTIGVITTKFFFLHFKIAESFEK